MLDDVFGWTRSEEEIVGPHKPGEQEQSLSSFCQRTETGYAANYTEVQRREVLSYRGYTVDEDAIEQACIELVNSDTDYEKLYDALGERDDEKNGADHPCDRSVGRCRTTSSATETSTKTKRNRKTVSVLSVQVVVLLVWRGM